MLFSLGGIFIPENALTMKVSAVPGIKIQAVRLSRVTEVR